MITLNLLEIYKDVFGEPYKLSNLGISTSSVDQYQPIPSKASQQKFILDSGLPLLAKNNYGKDIFAPIQFYKNSQNYLEISCASIRVNSKKTIVKTAVSERFGTVKELFNVGDYQFTIKGVLIGKNRQFPDDQILKLKELYETVETVELFNAYAELFMNKASRKIAIESLEFPEVIGKSIHIKPFVIVAESDFIDTLIVQ